MGLDSYTEVTGVSWFGRLMESIKGVVAGIVLFLISFPVLFWNEGRAVQTANSLQEGSKSVISVSTDKTDSANDGKLVYLNGKATTTGKLTDSKFGITVDAIKLRRVVEMYQWKETKKEKEEKKLGGGTQKETTYTYEKVWSKELFKSSNFKKASDHRNPSSMPFESQSWEAEKVTVGPYTLSQGLVGKIDKYERFDVSKKTTSSESKNRSDGDGKDRDDSDLSFLGNQSNFVGQDEDKDSSGNDDKDTSDDSGKSESKTSEPAGNVSTKDMKINDGRYYLGDNPESPKIGDVRITFEVVKPTTVSIVAKQNQSRLEGYKTKAGDTLEMLVVGTKSSDEMFKAEMEANVAMTWILRVVGFFLMFIGLSLVVRPFSVFADVIPFVGSIIGFGTTLFAFIISAMLSLVVIAIGWIFYRPLVGLAILFVVLLIGGGAVFLALQLKRPAMR